jgi:hypothetical protein
MRALIPILLLGVLLANAQQSANSASSQPAAAAPTGGDYVCPMDKDVRSDKPGLCPRCGMKMVLGIPDEVEYPLELQVTPALFHAGDKVGLAFRIIDPVTGKQVDHFEIVHEKLFHLFIVSQDLQYFLHEHPVPQSDGSFLYDLKFPKPGMYRVVGDFYPAGGTPQLIARTVIVPGVPGQEIQLVQAKLDPQLGTSHGENTDVELVMDPPKPVAGLETLLFFKLKDGTGLEKYLGAWAHMIAGSEDLVDVIHDHPYIADGGPQMQFNVIFPRARTYKIWVQFQRLGKVNTVSFTVPVRDLN